MQLHQQQRGMAVGTRYVRTRVPWYILEYYHWYIYTRVHVYYQKGTKIIDLYIPFGTRVLYHDGTSVRTRVLLNYLKKVP